MGSTVHIRYRVSNKDKFVYIMLPTWWTRFKYWLGFKYPDNGKGFYDYCDYSNRKYAISRRMNYLCEELKRCREDYQAEESLVKQAVEFVDNSTEVTRGISRIDSIPKSELPMRGFQEPPAELWKRIVNKKFWKKDHNDADELMSELSGGDVAPGDTMALVSKNAPIDTSQLKSMGLDDIQGNVIAVGEDPNKNKNNNQGNQRNRRKGESDKAYRERMRKLDEEN